MFQTCLAEHVKDAGLCSVWKTQEAHVETWTGYWSCYTVPGRWDKRLMTFPFKTVCGGINVLCCNVIAQWMNIKVELLHWNKVKHTGWKEQQHHRQTYITGVVHLVNSILLLEVLFREDPVNRKKGSASSHTFGRNEELTLSWTMDLSLCLCAELSVIKYDLW